MPQASYIINSYGPGYVIINNYRYNRTLIVIPNRIITDFPPQRIEQLAAHHFDLLSPNNFDVLLIGTGAEIYFPPPDIFSAWEDRHIGVEIMNTGAACRTYNLLVAEDRRVAALLFIQCAVKPPPFRAGI